MLPAQPRAADRQRRAGLAAGVRVIPRTGHLGFIALEASARLVLIDSCGVQKETSVLEILRLTSWEPANRHYTHNRSKLDYFRAPADNDGNIRALSNLLRMRRWFGGDSGGVCSLTIACLK